MAASGMTTREIGDKLGISARERLPYSEGHAGRIVLAPPQVESKFGHPRGIPRTPMNSENHN
jgi:hypothetical protein